MEQGKRGRKPLKNRDELKVQLPIYLRKTTIQALGGTLAAKEFLIAYAEQVTNANR